MKAPISYRKGIPFFCVKTATNFRRDVYENYDPMVIRQSALHLADQLWGQYPMQAILDFATDYYPNSSNPEILEIGCGVGRWIATLAQIYPEATCWGMDYSYQMLKRANEMWVLGKDIHLDLSNKGFAETYLKGHTLINLNFGLAKASNLPFSDNSQDLIVNSFLLDRLDNPWQGLAEMYRVLRPNGKLIAVTPLNFNQKIHWETLYPTHKIQELLVEMGFRILNWKEDWIIEEPLDFRGNKIIWKCLGFVVAKKL